jgi:putative CocE/NonD family hydrolase
MVSKISARIGISAAILAVLAGAAWLYFVRTDATRQSRARYKKYEFRIPMRDGVTLFTQVYIPKDQTKTYPFLVQRTPFGVSPYGEGRYRPRLGPSSEFDDAGYIFVFQDVRGRYQSQGEFVDMRPHIDHPTGTLTDESTDMYDTVEWLLTHVPSNNGRVGIWGMSYPGFYVSASIIDSHPAIKAASTQAPMTNLFLGDDAYHNGVFMLAAQFQVYANYFKPRASGPEFPSPKIGSFFDYGTSDGYKFFLEHGPGLQPIAALAQNPLLDENIRHDTYDDYWQQRDISQHLHNIHCPVLNVGGWFDAEDLAGPFRTYHAIAEANSDLPNQLVMGPWGHGDWLRSPGHNLGPLDFGSDTGAFFRSHVLFPFFEHYLKDAPAPDTPGALVFETGTNQWRSYASWPPPGTQSASLYLHADGKLSFDPPTGQEGAFDEYISDPANPVPYIEQPPTELASGYMYADQTFASHRPDVLTYKSDPLNQDVTVTGPLAVRLQVSSSGTDSDFIVKVIDEDSTHAPSPGYQQLVRGEPMRARFRNSFSTPEALQPNQTTAINYTMPDVNHTFLRGHRIVIQVQSTWFPLTDVNPQSFVQISSAKPADFVRATQRIFHKPEAASSIVLQILKR